MTHEFDTKNSLFFLPYESNTNNRRNFKKVVKELPEYFEKSKNINLDKQILRDNTRLPDEFLEEIANRSNNKDKNHQSIENSDLVQLMKELNRYDEERKTVPTPIINGYKLIKEPKAEDLLKQIPVNWEETPSIKSEKKYSIQQSSEREKLAHTLALKTVKKPEEKE